LRVSGFGFRVRGYPEKESLKEGFSPWRSKAFRFSVSGFGFRVSRFGFRVPGIGLRGSGFGFRVLGVGFRVGGLGLSVPLVVKADSLKRRLMAGILGFMSRVSGVGCRDEGRGWMVQGVEGRIEGCRGAVQLVGVWTVPVEPSVLGSGFKVYRGTSLIRNSPPP